MLLDWNLLGDNILSKSGYLGFCVLSTHCQTPWGWLFANPIIQLLLSIFIQENIYLTFLLRARQALCKYTDCGFLKFKSQMVGHRLLLLKLLCNMIFDKERLVKSKLGVSPPRTFCGKVLQEYWAGPANMMRAAVADTWYRATKWVRRIELVPEMRRVESNSRWNVVNLSQLLPAKHLQKVIFAFIIVCCSTHTGKVLRFGWVSSNCWQ